MNGSRYEFVWPSAADAIPVLLIFVVLPLWLIQIVLKYTRISRPKKALLIPVCLVSPLILAAL